MCDDVTSVTIDPFDLLCLLNRLCHGKENTVDQNGEHHNVVKVLVGAEVDAYTTHLEKKRARTHQL